MYSVIMLSSLDALEKGYEATVKKSKKDCGDELEKIRQLTLNIIPKFFESFMEYRESLVSKYMDSLVDTCFWELFRTSGHTLFLSCNGLYRNAFDNIRHTLESHQRHDISQSMVITPPAVVPELVFHAMIAADKELI